MSLTIWTNALFPEAETRLLAEGVGRHRLVAAPSRSTDRKSVV